MTPQKLRLAFIGTPDFAVPALRALLDSPHEVVAVYSQSPKPAGRGYHVQKSPVQNLAEERGVSVRTPPSLKSLDEQKYFAELRLDCAVVAAYGHILPRPILEAPRLGCINIHASLLPRWRGAAPIHRALLAGDQETGVTIMKMDAGLDTGPMLLQKSCAITETSTTSSLHDCLAAMGAPLILEALEGVALGTLKEQPQPQAGVTYAAKLTREESQIHWSKSAKELERQVRGLYPWPGTHFVMGGEIVKLLSARVERRAAAKPGTLLDENMTIACGEDALQLLLVQRAGKKPIDGASFLRGQKHTLGQVL